MKFLIENYANSSQTQCLYLNTILNSHDSCKSFLYNSKERSMYDVLDKFSPDYFITHASLLKNDFVVYCKQEKKDIKLLLNIQGLSNDNVAQLDISLQANDINCPILFTTINSSLLPKIKHRRLLQLLDAFDPNLTRSKKIATYQLPKAFFVLNQHDIDEEVPYHIITINDKIKKYADICIPEVYMSTLYSNYEEVIFYDINNYIPQSFFDAIAMGNKVYFKSENKDTIEMINNILKPEKSLNYDDEDKLQDFTNIKKYVLDKHSGQNRVKTLLSQLPKE